MSLIKWRPEDGFVDEAEANNLAEDLLVAIEGLPVKAHPAVQLEEDDGEAENERLSFTAHQM